MEISTLPLKIAIYGILKVSAEIKAVISWAEVSVWVIKMSEKNRSPIDIKAPRLNFQPEAHCGQLHVALATVPWVQCPQEWWQLSAHMGHCRLQERRNGEAIPNARPRVGGCRPCSELLMVVNFSATF